MLYIFEEKKGHFNFLFFSLIFCWVGPETKWGGLGLPRPPRGYAPVWLHYILVSLLWLSVCVLWTFQHHLFYYISRKRGKVHFEFASPISCTLRYPKVALMWACFWNLSVSCNYLGWQKCNTAIHCYKKWNRIYLINLCLEYPSIVNSKHSSRATFTRIVE